MRVSCRSRLREAHDAVGDTMFVNRYCAHKALSPGIQKILVAEGCLFVRKLAAAILDGRDA